MANKPKTNIDTTKKVYKPKYPGPEYYGGFGNTCPLSPCMSPYWRSISIRQGKKILDTEHDLKPEEPEEPEENQEGEYNGN